MYKTISEIKAVNKANGYHFFSTDTMRFFSGKTHRGVYGGKYFVTSEQFVSTSGVRHPRKYTIRKAHPDGAIDTVDTFQKFSTLDEAVSHIRYEILKEDDEY
tara:strand:+ start:82 stop:387 length:306 start_codon:yes stop_codon:yes gene_type:complete